MSASSRHIGTQQRAGRGGGNHSLIWTRIARVHGLVVSFHVFKPVHIVLNLKFEIVRHSRRSHFSGNFFQVLRRVEAEIDRVSVLFGNSTGPCGAAGSAPPPRTPPS